MNKKLLSIAGLVCWMSAPAPAQWFTYPKQGTPRTADGKPNLVVNISARHAHVTQEDLERLYGKGHQLKPLKALYQDGFFAAEETVTMIGPRSGVIPCRSRAMTDSIAV